MSDSHSSSWKEPYLAALVEPDTEKLAKLVHATELTLFRRVQELAGFGDGHEERREIGAACKNLFALKSLISGR
jgi:hypothetical protein